MSLVTSPISLKDTLDELGIDYKVEFAASMTSGEKIIVLHVEPGNYAEIADLCSRAGLIFGIDNESGISRMIVSFNAGDAA